MHYILLAYRMLYSNVLDPQIVYVKNVCGCFKIKVFNETVLVNHVKTRNGQLGSVSEFALNTKHCSLFCHVRFGTIKNLVLVYGASC